ncbi:NAD(P)H-dependent oxidoreductase [Proteinivorax hydrogeniformans]|uniref:NAD(P)H-dependent oxidoreductase n=1 Tax=Proteinivorax hydrogeniformans TaxID=1826727 RepID=A0AAU8HWA4_9FIRM
MNRKTLILYYSLDGNCKFVADELANNLEGEVDTLRIEPKKDITGGKFKRYFWGGAQVFMKKEPEIKPINLDLDDYANIIIGTPVWAWTFSPPIRSFLNLYPLTDKKIALYSCHGGQLGKTINDMRNYLQNNTIVSEMDFFEPATKDSEVNKKTIAKWAQKLQKVLS